MPFKAKNHILSHLGDEDVALLAPNLVLVELPLRLQLEAAGKPIGHVYFPEEGLVSVVALGTRDQSIEVGIIGRDGMTGHPVVMGTDRSANATYIQIAGRGWRIESDELRAALRRSESLQKAFLAFLQSFTVQASHTALANGRAKIEERLARWLLVAHDRLEGDRLPLTHEFLAVMLGVQRPGVSLALQTLEGAALITTQRGVITVKNRNGLKRVAVGIYGVPEAEQGRLTGWRPLHD